MPHRQNSLTMPASREVGALLAVDRAVFELRRGRVVAVAAADGARALVMAAEGATDESLKELAQLAGNQPILTITRRRAEVLQLGGEAVGEQDSVLALSLNDLNAEAILRLADPLTDEPTDEIKRAQVHAVPTHGPQTAAVGLAKIARLLPAALVAPLLDSDSADLAGWTARRNLILVDAGDIFQYEHTAARNLKRVSEARVPLEDAENTHIIAYRPQDGGLEHLAIVIGEPSANDDATLVRIHSECFTGDLLGSLRCDCGDQLRGAIQAIAENGSGVLLYLAQEGRGIGLVNKLRAYTLQDRGLDTLDANEMLGYDADERVYLPAAEMLRDLRLKQVHLLTNNPDKVTALSRFGIDVVQRVPHAFPSNKHNEQYLQTKKAKGGHLF